MEIIKALEILDPKIFKQLSEEVLAIYEKHQSEDHQVILQTSKPGIEDWHSGIGQVEELGDKTENDYLHIQPSLSGTLIEQYIKKYKGFRTRILGMHPRTSYSVHKDFTPRIHIPITSNKHSWMIWPTHQRCYQLKTGVIYFTDTTRIHTAINGSLDEVRVHVVMCVEDDQSA